MKNAERWTPGKYVNHRGHLRGSRNTRELRRGSRLVTDIVAHHYEIYLKTYAKGKLIDLGCGKAPLYGCYRDLVTSTTCVDWESSLHRNEYLDFSCNLTEPLPFESNTFDTVLFSDVLEHLPEPGTIWRELERIMAPGGVLLLTTPFIYSLHEVPHDYFRYSEFALRHYAEQQGLDILVLKALGGSVEVMADICAKHIEVVPVVGGLMASLAQTFAALIGRTRFGVRIRDITSARFPLEYFLVAQKPLKA